MTQNARPILLHTIGSRWSDSLRESRRFPFTPDELLDLGAGLRLTIRGQFVDEQHIAETQVFIEAGVQVQIECDDGLLLTRTMERLSVRSEMLDSPLFYPQTA